MFGKRYSVGEYMDIKFMGYECRCGYITKWLLAIMWHCWHCPKCRQDQHLVPK
jgi:hypothetical protein